MRYRQLRARALRPLARRRFPGGEPPGEASPVPLARDLWASPAFAAAGASTRLARLHGDDVLAAARAGDLVETRHLIETWIEAHPPQSGDAWDPHALSARVGNWVAALTLVPELASPAFSGSLWRQLQRLRANIEDDLLGHHVIRNARALVLGGISFGAADVMRDGIELLRRELPEQVLRDGGHYEHSPACQLVVLRDLLEVQAAWPHSWLAEAIERMQRFAAALARPDGAPALFNVGTVDAPRLELPEAPEGVSVFGDSGFVVARDGPLWLAFRCGPAAPDFLSTRAHADALSFQLWWRGRPVLVDPGGLTDEPGTGGDWFRSARAHSTVTVDGRSSGVHPKVSLRYAREQAVEASVVLPGRVRHVRRIEWSENDVFVVDQFVGKGRHRVESRLVWAPGPPAVEFALHGDGELTSEDGFVSERSGEQVPTAIGCIVAELVLPGSIGFRLRCLG